MLRWKTDDIVIGVAGREVLSDILGGQSGKNRVIKFISGPKTTDLTLRVYRDGDQIVDFDTDLFTTGFTLLPVDIKLDVGQIAKAGYKDDGAGAATYKITIGYEEVS